MVSVGKIAGARKSYSDSGKKSAEKGRSALYLTKQSRALLTQRISGPVVVTNFATALSSSPWDLVFARADAPIFTTIEVGVRRTGRAVMILKMMTARFGLRTSTSMVVKM